MTARIAARMAIDNDAHIVCLCDITKKDRHAIQAIVTELRRNCGETVSIIGSANISSHDRQCLRQTGCTQIFATDLSDLNTVHRVLDQLFALIGDQKNAKYFIDGVLAKDRRTIAKTISLIESRAMRHRIMAEQVLNGLFPYAGNAVRIGLTGIPGAGKSTFIESLGTRLVEMGKRVAVLAIDPSSFLSGGSLLADKTRMPKLSANSKAIIRPFSAGGMLGGVAGATRETIMIYEAAGFDVIIVETVGIGQSEIAAAQMVDFFMLLQIAGAGDQFQGIKKGIIEMVDAIAITKADGDNIEKANKSRTVYAEALSLMQPRSDRWTPPVVTCSAHDPDSIDNIWYMISKYIEQLTSTGELAQKRSRQATEWMITVLDQEMINRFCENPQVMSQLEDVMKSIKKGEITPDLAARKLLSVYDSPVV
jgi:LAO/AO transport system kinase